MARAYVTERIDGVRQVVVEQCGVLLTADAIKLSEDILAAVERLYDPTPLPESEARDPDRCYLARPLTQIEADLYAEKQNALQRGCRKSYWDSVATQQAKRNAA